MCVHINLCKHVQECILGLVAVCLLSFSSLGKPGCTWPLIISAEPESEASEPNSDSVDELVLLKSFA